MKNIGALIFNNHPAFEELAKNAYHSFIKWHPDLDCHLITPEIYSLYYAKYVPGYQKTIAAECIMSAHKYDKLIVLGADTITTARLDEFIDSDEDIVGSLDYPQEPHPFGYSKDQHPYMNADVVCYGNLDVLVALNFLAPIIGPPLFEQGAQNIIVNGTPPLLPEIDPGIKAKVIKRLGQDYYDQRIEKIKGFLNGKAGLDWDGSNIKVPENISCRVIDYPYEPSKVVYNVRSKVGLSNPKTDDECYERNIVKFKVEDDKLITEDGKHIKVFHIGEGLGNNKTNKGFENLIQKYLNWFNDDTKKFFVESCNCSGWITKNKYPKWKFNGIGNVTIEFDELKQLMANRESPEKNEGFDTVYYKGKK